MTYQPETPDVTRRDFIRTAAATAAGFAAARATAQPDSSRIIQPDPATHAHAAGPERIRVGLVGCGGRGTGAARDCMQADDAVVISAMGDAFRDRLDQSFEQLRASHGERVQVPEDRKFVGFDAFRHVIDSGVDLLILATPPHFRPQHLRAAVEAGKHCFIEKPVAVDPVGVRSVIETADLADSKGLSIVAGTQRRHEVPYIETVRRIHDGAIGEPLAGRCFWCMGGLWVHERRPEWSDMEWQLRNWLYFNWLSGDHIVEQHIHQLDVMNWVFDGPPVKAFGMGGRQARTGDEFGNIWDHFSVEYEYANGARVLSFCRQTPGASDRISEHVVGSEGRANVNGRIEGKHAWNYDGRHVSPLVQEHADLIASLRGQSPRVNDARRVAESTMTAILGRMSAYTGRELSWNWALNASKLDLTPPAYEWGDLPVRPVAIPGQTELV